MGAESYTLDRNETLRYLGYRGQELDEQTEARLRDMTDLCLRTAAPKYVFERYSFTRTAAGIHLDGTAVTLEGSDIAAHLEGASALCLMAATLGHGCDRTSLRLEHTDLASAVTFNAATVTLIEAVSDRCQKEMGALFSSEGLHVNGRYSPGYGNFPLTQQREVLRLLRAEERLGITLTEGYLMLPRKSVTAVVGLFREEQEKRVSCTVCAMRTFCEYRKLGDHCG